MSDVRGEDRAEAPAEPRTPLEFHVEPLQKHGKDLACSIIGAGANGGVIELDSTKSHTITFKLDNGKYPDLKFVDEQDSPFCSLTEDCPKKGDQIGQFPNMSVTDRGKTLTVTADPGSDPIVHYALLFVDSQGHNCKWDPIIINH